MEYLRELVALVVWVIANAVYVDAKRRGVGGLRRLAAFWVGVPATWVWLFLLREGKEPRIAPPPDADRALLEEIRRDRDARALEAPRHTDDEPEEAT